VQFTAFLTAAGVILNRTAVSRWKGSVGVLVEQPGDVII
jgi:hypothetical protein